MKTKIAIFFSASRERMAIIKVHLDLQHLQVVAFIGLTKAVLLARLIISIATILLS